ncbi:PilN domain-containing protein [unidentified bacterial endosymbiont]|uniref:PilN domain-containing protein n=1 Tax=unidentified bacterial endosymbiont TaxID=2355 RepID=UPI0020A105C8|nr:PilN domain-containing protein [unidentified bacterial endosymbiont]
MERVNLLPWRQASTRRRYRAWNVRAGTLLISLLSLSIGADWLLHHLIQQQQQRWQLAHQQSQQQQAQQAAIQALRLESDQQWQRYQQPLQLLEQLSRLIPAGIYLQRWHWQPPRLTLQGSALSYSVLAEFIETLHHDPLIPPLQLSQATTEESQQAMIQFCLQGSWLEDR